MTETEGGLIYERSGETIFIHEDSDHYPVLVELAKELPKLVFDLEYMDEYHKFSFGGPVYAKAAEQYLKSFVEEYEVSDFTKDLVEELLEEQKDE